MSWHGPAKVIAHRGRSLFIIANRNIRKVADCRIQPYESGEEKEDRKIVAKIKKLFMSKLRILRTLKNIEKKMKLFLNVMEKICQKE